MDQVTMIDEQRLREAGLSADTLRAAARKDAGRWTSILQAKDPEALDRRATTAARSLHLLLAELDQLPTKGWPGAEPLLEIRENPRMMHSALSELRSVRRKLQRLPRALSETPSGPREEPRAATVAESYLGAGNGVWNADTLRIYLAEWQKAEPLLLAELWVLPALLRFVLLEQILEQAEARFQALTWHENLPVVEGPAGAEEFARLMTARIQSLREIAYVDWFFIIEPMVVFDSLLRQDPAEAYPKMDFDSREVYRKQVARIARYSDCTETDVARHALELAQESMKRPIHDSRVYWRRAHVGYYLIDRGFDELQARIG